MKISVIIPVYKVEPFLPRCVDSVLGQTYKNLEVILVDDGSPDRCPALCDEYARSDNRVQVIHKPNGGLSDARNYGIRAATGEFLMFLDSDDYWERENAVELLVEKKLKNNPDVVILKETQYYIKSNKFYRNAFKVNEVELLKLSLEDQLRCLISTGEFKACAWDKVVKREIIIESDLFFKVGVVAEDVDWCARLALCISSIDIFPDNFYVYIKQRQGSITSHLTIKNLRDTKWNLEFCIGLIKDAKKSRAFNEFYYSYLAYRYIIWLAEYEIVCDKNKKDLLNEMNQLKWILLYNMHPKVEAIYKLYKLLGINIIRKVLGIYLTVR